MPGCMPATTANRFSTDRRTRFRIICSASSPSPRNLQKRYKLPLISGVGGAESIYPEFMAKLKTVTDTEALSRFKPVPGRPSETSRALDPEPHDGEIHVLPVRNNVYMLVGDGANIVVQVGDQGALVVDTGTGALADKTIAAISTLPGKPVQFIANTGFRPDHTGGNVKVGTPAWTRVSRAPFSQTSSPMRAKARRLCRTRTRKITWTPARCLPKEFLATRSSKSTAVNSTTVIPSSCFGSRMP